MDVLASNERNEGERTKMDENQKERGRAGMKYNGKHIPRSVDRGENGDFNLRAC